MNYHESWSTTAKEAFEKTIAAHGGWAAWENFKTVDLRLKEFRGLLPYIKGLGVTFQSPLLMTIDPKKRYVEFSYENHKDSYQDGALIFSAQKKSASNGREIFKRSTFEKWHPQHGLYFFGYAWSNYIGYPFILPQFELLEWKSKSSSSWFKIRFPESFHTHSQVQKFYFDRSHLLFRHDYHADVAGLIFYGAHFTEGYENHDGLKIACVRKVRPGIGHAVAPIYGIFARLEIAAPTH